MGRVVSIKVPNWVASRLSAENMTLRDGMAAAAVARLDPDFEGLGGDGRIERPRLDGEADAYLERLSSLHAPKSKGTICAGLLASYVRLKDGDPDRLSSGSTIARMMRTMGLKARVQQENMLAAVNTTLATGQIGAHEASAGTGKTYVMVAAAFERIAEGERVVISAPTIADVVQTGKAISRLQDAGYDVPRWRMVFGRGEFVSASAVESRLSDDETKDQEGVADVKAWLERTKAAGDEGDWRLASLMAAAPAYAGISTCAVTAYTDKEDLGVVAYKRQFADDAAKLIICTHAMLAIDCLLRRMRVGSVQEYKGQSEAAWNARETSGSAPSGPDDFWYKVDNEMRARFEATEHCHLPSYQVAIVDEAHQLEQAFASVMAIDVSLWNLHRALSDLRKLNKDAVSEAAVKNAKRAFAVLQPGDEDEGSAHREINPNDADAEVLRPLLASLKNVKEDSRRCGKNPEAQRTVASAREALAGLFAAKGSTALLSFSPSRRYPRLLIGSKTTHRELNYLWASVKSAALVSATLFVPTKNEGNSANQIRMLLHIPFGRFHDKSVPIINEHVYLPVTCITPDPSKARDGWLCRPTLNGSKKKFAEAEKRWCDDVARTIAAAADTAEGGMLVLTTSYKMIEDLEKRLVGELNGRLLLSAKGKRLATLSEEFLQRAKSGERPVWLATGGAWTGLDIGGNRIGVAAKDDNILTDLVMVNIPWRTNRSLAHVNRARLGIHAEFLDTFLKYKQGLGRLVRNPSPDLPKNRRLWMLDGRIYSLAWRGRLESFSALLRAYPRSATV